MITLGAEDLRALGFAFLAFLPPPLATGAVPLVGVAALPFAVPVGTSATSTSATSFIPPTSEARTPTPASSSHSNVSSEIADSFLIIAGSVSLSSSSLPLSSSPWLSSG